MDLHFIHMGVIRLLAGQKMKFCVLVTAYTQIYGPTFLWGGQSVCLSIRHWVGTVLQDHTCLPRAVYKSLYRLVYKGRDLGGGGVSWPEKMTKPVSLHFCWCKPAYCLADYRKCAWKTRISLFLEIRQRARLQELGFQHNLESLLGEAVQMNIFTVQAFLNCKATSISPAIKKEESADDERRCCWSFVTLLKGPSDVWTGLWS